MQISGLLPVALHNFEQPRLYLCILQEKYYEFEPAEHVTTVTLKLGTNILLHCRNYNYGPTGKALKKDLLNHPDLLSTNATLAFQAAIWYWVTPAKTRPSPHEVMVGKWVPTKNDTRLNRQPGFGMTINIKASDVECGHGDDPRMLDRISHYLYFLQGYFGVSDPGKNLDCGLQGVVPMAYAAI